MDNKNDIATYLRWLLAAPCQDKSLVFQLFAERKEDKKNKSLTRVLVGHANKTSENIKAAVGLNNNRAGVFVQVNGGKGRGASYVKNIRAVFLDLDGAPIAPVKEAIKAKKLPAPGLIVESSPGRYHVYWYSLDVMPDTFALAQKTLAARFGGDMVVHNLDRVMRLPGTTHWKHEPFLARIIYAAADGGEPLDLETILELTNDVTEVADPKAAQAMVSQFYEDTDVLTASLAMDGYVSTNALDEDELPAGDRTQKIIAAAGALVVKHPNDDLKSLAKMLVRWAQDRYPKGDKGLDATAWRQEIFPGLRRFVQRRDQEVKVIKNREADLSKEYTGGEFTAFAESRDPDAMSMADFANRFVYVADGELVYDLEQRPNQKPMKKAAFITKHGVHTKEGSKIARKWLESKAHRRALDTVGYKPYAHTADKNKLLAQRFVRDQDTDQLYFNTYTPPILTPVHAESADEIREKTGIFFKHLSWLMRDKRRTGIMLDWLAATIQRPDRRVTWAPLLISTYEGVGKGWFAQLVEMLIGASNYGFVTTEDFTQTNQYNEFLANTTVVVFDEVHMPGKRSFTNRLKAMITEPTLNINVKFGARGRQKIYSSFLLFSNHTDALAIGKHDRRFFVHIFDDPPKEAAYYNELFRWLKTDGPSYLLQWLLDRDLGHFNWGECPKFDLVEDDKYEVIESSLDSLVLLLDGLLEDRIGPFKFGLCCQPLIERWLINQERVTLEREEVHKLNAWVRENSRVLGRISGLDRVYRNVRWRTFDPEITKQTNGSILRKLARQSITHVEGVDAPYIPDIPANQDQELH